MHKLRILPYYVRRCNVFHQKRLFGLPTAETTAKGSDDRRSKEISPAQASNDMFATVSPGIIPMVLTEKDPIVLPFDEVPGPKSLKALSKARQYLTATGTQLTAGAINLGVSLEAFFTGRKRHAVLSSLFDKYGPVVRFVSPVGTDVVLLNQPHLIRQVFSTEDREPVRSMLDSLEKFRTEHRLTEASSGLFNVQGKEWQRKRDLVYQPLQNTLVKNIVPMEQVCENFIEKIHKCKDYHDEVNNVYNLVHKWAFDCMGHLIFSKKFTMLNTEIVYSQCDMSWLYRSLQNSTDAILKCESGLQMFKVFPTLSWRSLVKNCSTLDNLIGKFVIESDRNILFSHNEDNSENSYDGMVQDESLVVSLMRADEKLTSEDISVIIMDMLLLGVNTVSSSMSFLLYYLAKHQKVQRQLHSEIERVAASIKDKDFGDIKKRTPYLSACIKEVLRLTPPIPVLTRILTKNIVLDKFTIPRGTLIVMCTQDASLRESNFDDAEKFYPDRWMKPEAKDYHSFASIPFGFGSRSCLGQNIAETMLSFLTFKVIEKFKLEYHYGDVYPTRSFIAKPDKPLKIRFMDRI